MNCKKGSKLLLSKLRICSMPCIALSYSLPLCLFPSHSLCFVYLDLLCLNFLRIIFDSLIVALKHKYILSLNRVYKGGRGTKIPQQHSQRICFMCKFILLSVRCTCFNCDEKEEREREKKLEIR